ncbi:MAG: cysteine desulfurase-like protein [Candidatus Obscuribacterales bacterium]|nr:cysteine desulfurase-like protein [Candidatus Obscuribacterales bacterium]
MSATASTKSTAMEVLQKLAVRKHFPALTRSVNGLPAAFLDGPGGTQVPQQVIDAVSSYYSASNANTGGCFVTSQETDEIIEQGRKAMADLLGCSSAEIVFGANMTSLTFSFSRALGRDLQPGDEVITTVLDHDANVAPWKALEERGAVVHAIGIRESDCTLDMDEFATKLNKRTKIVAVGYASNAVGTINDVKRIVAMAHEVGAIVYIDAVHYAPHGPIDVRELDCDFLACSPYKFFAPHLGVVYGKKELLSRLLPYKVRPADSNHPFCWETGTQSFESIAGLVAGIDYLASIGAAASSSKGESRRHQLLTAMELIKNYEKSLSERMIAGVKNISGIKLFGISELESTRLNWRTPTFGLVVKAHSPLKVAEQLAKDGIFVWNGNFYALQLTELLGLEELGGLVRVGAVHYNTYDEIDRCLKVLDRIASE